MRNGNVKSELDLNARKRVNRTCKAWTRLLKHEFTQDGWILDSRCSTKNPYFKATPRKNEFCLLVHRDVQKGTDNVDVRLKWKQLYKKIFCLSFTFHCWCTPAVRETCWMPASCCFAKAPQTAEAIPGIWGQFWITFLDMSSIGYFHQLCSFWSDDLLGPLKNMFCSRCGNGNEQWSYFRWWRFWIFPGDLHQLVDIRHRLGILDRRWRLVSMKLLNVGNPLLNHLYFRLYKIKMEAEALLICFNKTFAWAAVSFTLFTRLPARLVFLLTDLNWNWENIKPVREQIPKKRNRSKNRLGGQEW